MLVVYEPFKGMKMIKFQDIRDKYNKVVELQRKEREVLRGVVNSIMQNFSDSLELEKPHWTHPGDGQCESYVFLMAMKDDQNVRTTCDELMPDESGSLPFSVGLTVDKSLVSFPKMHLITRVNLRRDGAGFTVTVGKHEFETGLSEKPTEAELSAVSEAIKQTALKTLDDYIPGGR